MGTGPVMPASALTSRDGDLGVTLCGESATLALLGEVGLQNPYSLHLPLLSPLLHLRQDPGWWLGKGQRMKWGKSITILGAQSQVYTRGCTLRGVHTHTSHAQRNECLSMHEHIHTCTARLNTYMHPAPTTYSWVHADTPTGPHAHHSRLACTQRACTYLHPRSHSSQVFVPDKFKVAL